MITERPLKEVPTKALYALHRGIEKEAGLVRHKLIDMVDGGRCALASLGYSVDEIRDKAIALELFDKDGMETNDEPWDHIRVLNNGFEGTREERREFMLRHIVEELRQRSKPLPNKSDQAPKILTHEIG